MTSSKHRGFSLLELLIVVSIGMIMAGVTFMALKPLLNQDHVDQSYDTVLGVMRTYRNLSIAQSKRYIMIFTPPRTLQVEYWGVGVPVNPAPVPVATYTLPSDISYAVQAGFPNPGPENFGTGNTAVTVNNCALVTQNCVIFYPDGSAQDDTGNFNNGVIYLTRPGDLYSSRALTIWGTTGRMRGWRLYLQGGVNKWVQQ
ncbi:MAG TPA: prepilin-type N-terminal cleavage/methylation domain-containing protein [Candidatus Sulfotelmatobacter sp.]|jgi:prepilin-type N-terminal cleavage/methylation domain-containing protein